MSDDDVNKSNKPVNGKLPKHIHEAFKGRDYNVSYENLSSREDYSKLSDKLEALEHERSAATDPAQIQATVENIGYIEADLEALESQYAHRYNEQLASTITTYSKARNINERTTTMSSQQRFFRQARASEDKYVPTEVLERRIQSGVEEAAGLGSEIAGRSRGLGAEESVPDSIREKASRMQQIQEEVALNKRLLRVQSREGLSTEKRQYAASDVLERAGGVLSQDRLTKEVAGGKYGNLVEETDKLSDMFSRLQESLGRFEQASENATDAQGNLTDEYKEASKDLDDIQRQTEHQRRVVGEVSRQHGGASNRWDAMKQNLGTIGGIVNGGYAVDIEDKMSEMRLKGAMGQTSVDQFNRVQSAVVDNDARALLRETSGQEFVKQFSDDLRSKSLRRAGVQTAIGGGETLAEGVLGFKSGGISGAVLNAGETGMGAFRKFMQTKRGIPQTMTALEAERTAGQYFSTLTEVPAQGLQAVMDQAMLAGQATIGGGSMGRAPEETLLDTWWLSNQAAKKGLSPEQASALTGQSLRQIGTTEAGTSVAIKAATAERRKLLGREEYIGAAAQLSNVGAGTDNLEQIMKNAVAAGMDNAKNINQMVQATVQMSASLSKMGVSADGAENLVSASIQSLRETGVSRNQASDAALSALQFQKKVGSNLSVNVGSVAETGMLAEMMPESTLLERMSLAKMGEEDFAAIMKGGKGTAENYGMGGLYERVRARGGDMAKYASEANMRSMPLRMEGYLWGMDTEKEGLAMARGDSPSAKMKQAAFLQGGVNATGFTPATKLAEAGELPEEADNYLNAQKVRAASYKASMVQMGADTEGGMGQTLAALTTALQALSDNLSPEKAQERVEQTARDMKSVGPIVEAGDSFKDAAGIFSKAVGSFNKKLSSTDMAETRVEFNMREDNRSMKKK